MEANSQNKQSDNQQQAGNSTGSKSFWDELDSKLSGLSQEPSTWIKWLSSPLLPVIGLIVLGYCLHRTRKELIEILHQQKVTNAAELAKLRKKVKKLKKQIRQSSGNSSRSAKALMD